MNLTCLIIIIAGSSAAFEIHLDYLLSTDDDGVDECLFENPNFD